jgi:hypothetical protein
MTLLGSDLYVFYNEGFPPWKLTVDWNSATYFAETLDPTGFDYAYWWTSSTQMLSAADGNGNIYVFQTDWPSFVKFDPVANTMVEMAPIPGLTSASQQTPATLTKVGNQLRLMGGTHYNSSDAGQWQQQWIYDPGMDTWTRSEDCPVGFTAHASCEIVERASLLVAGGESATPSTTFKTAVYETEQLPIDAPVMSALTSSMMSIYPTLLETTVLGDSFIAATDLDPVYGGTITPGIRATGIPV